MKTSKPLPTGDATPSSSNRRSQPVRQTRTNPPRNSATANRNANGRDKPGSGHPPDHPIEIFPGITHFTDAITALPKDLVRHFTLLKEVDAKICQPEEQLFQIVHDLLETPLPKSRSANTVPPSSIAPVSAAHGSTHFSPAGDGPTSLVPQNNANSRATDPSLGTENVPRRLLVRQVIQKMSDTLVSLEEKNHVISVANDNLQRQLNRVEEIWPHLQKEFSDEAKWGSTTHWAYPENRLNRNAQQQAHNGRRDATGHLTAAAQALAEEVAARSETRKQAVAAKKRHGPHHESDLDDPEKHKNEHSKKSHHKSRKTAAESPAHVGLGITSAGNTPNGNPPAKRRKVDKAANGTPAAERAMATVLGKEGAKGKTASPRSTPAPEQPPRKRKPLPTSSSSNGAKKKNGVAGAALPPSTTSSPVLNNLPDTKVTRSSPASTSVPKAAVSRAKQASVPASAEKSRPSPAAQAKSSHTSAPKSPFLGPVTNHKAKSKDEPAISKEVAPAAEAKQNAPRPEPDPTPAAAKPPSNGPAASAKSSHSKKEGSSKPEDKPTKSESTPGAQSAVPTPVTTTKSGRASKPSTPALGSFPDPGPGPAKSRPSRASEAGGGKRSHKKGANSHPSAPPRRPDGGDANSAVLRGGRGGEGDDDDGDDNDINPDEETYCYCNGVSYGEMVACDADDCEREWFHLECVGLKVAPKTNAKWYCEDCKEKMKNSGKKVNGR